MRVWAKARRRPVDAFAVLTASLSSIFIIINAVFLQPVSRSEIDERERLTFKLQDLQKFLKSEAQSLGREIESALAKIKIMQTPSDLNKRRGG